jgi:hypothetical protein
VQIALLATRFDEVNVAAQEIDRADYRPDRSERMIDIDLRQIERTRERAVDVAPPSFQCVECGI